MTADDPFPILHAAPDGSTCGLSLDELEKRRRLLEAECLPLVTAWRQEPGRIRARLRVSQAQANRLARRLANLEAECCAFLTFAASGDGTIPALEISGPDDFLTRLTAWWDGWRRAAGG